MAIAGNDRESRDARVPNRVEDLAAFGDQLAPVAAAKTGKARTAPQGRSGRQILRVRSRGERRKRVAPDLPWRARGLQLGEEPRLLLRTEHRRGRLGSARVGDVLSSELDRGGRVAAVVGLASVVDLEDFFGDEVGELRLVELVPLGSVGRDGRPIAALIGEEQIEIGAPLRGTVRLQAGDRREVVLLLSESLSIELRDRRAGDLRWIEGFERRPARLLDAGRLVLPPRLVRGHLPRLRGTDLAAKHLDPLIALPRVFVVVPDTNEWPARASVLDIRIVQVPAIHHAVVAHRRRDVEIADLLAVGIPRHIEELAIEIALGPIFRVPDDLVDEVAEMQNEVDAILVRRALVFVDHPPVRVLEA